MSSMLTTEWMDLLHQGLGRTRARLGENFTSVDEALNHAAGLLVDVRGRDGTLWWVGNGGSAAIASHLAQDVIGKLRIKSFTFMDAALLTCNANDFGYDAVYSRPLDRMARQGDMLIAISSSGNSQNILNSVQVAKERGMRVMTLSGFTPDNRLWGMDVDVALHFPSELYGLVEVGHVALLHGLIETMYLNENAQPASP